MQNISRISISILAVAALAAGCSSSAKKKEYNDQVEDALGSKHEAVQKCFKSAQAQGRPGSPVSEGEIELSMNVGPAGKVTHVSVIRSTMNSKILEDCVAEVVRRAEFSKASDGRVKQFTRIFHFGTQATSEQ